VLALGYVELLGNRPRLRDPNRKGTTENAIGEALEGVPSPIFPQHAHCALTQADEGLFALCVDADFVPYRHCCTVGCYVIRFTRVIDVDHFKSCFFKHALHRRYIVKSEPRFLLGPRVLRSEERRYEKSSRSQEITGVIQRHGQVLSEEGKYPLCIHNICRARWNIGIVQGTGMHGCGLALRNVSQCVDGVWILIDGVDVRPTGVDQRPRVSSAACAKINRDAGA
jgi:hypothetical protein